jgi:hypothetical protein
MSNRPRPCEKQCVECHEWKHHSRFRSFKTRHGRHNNMSAVSFHARCRDCEQRLRNEKKNADRPKAIVEQRARSAAAKAGVSFEFAWTELNYRALVADMRAKLSPEGLCNGCGHKFLNERDIQIEHIEPPRSDQDWARLHARNLRLVCGSCNRTKGKKPFLDWLEDQEGARLSHLKLPKVENQIAEEIWWQPSLFDLYGQQRK